MSKIVLTERQLNILEASVKKDERIKLYQDEHILVVVPLSFQASCKYGANTSWCTATPSSNESYNTYGNNGIFFYFIIKSPYQNAKIKEYKFAYYHSFNKSYNNRTGWYDMDDYFYQDEDPSGQRGADINLIEFLIPEFIFEKVSEYIETQRSVFEEKKQEKYNILFKKILNDDKNTIITIDTNMFLFYRINDFPPGYGDIANVPFYTLNKDIALNFYYCDLINKKIYRQSLQYAYDISNITNSESDYIKIFKLMSNGMFGLDNNLNSLFIKYKNNIKPHYYQQRKLNYIFDTIIFGDNEIPYDKEKHNP